MVRIAHSLASLRAQLNVMAPGRSKVSDGWLGDMAHQGRVSDHNPDAGGIVRALDVTDDPAGGLDALWLREALRKGRDPRIKYVISEGQIFSSYPGGGYPAWTWRPYVGPNKHTKHVHVSVNAGAAGDRAGTWVLGRELGAPVRPPTPDPAPPTVEDDPMGMYASKAEFETAIRRNVRSAPITLDRTGQTTTLERALSWLDKQNTATLAYVRAAIAQDATNAQRILDELEAAQRDLTTTSTEES